MQPPEPGSNPKPRRYQWLRLPNHRTLSLKGKSKLSTTLATVKVSPTTRRSIQGFLTKGIAEADIKPRENVFTFNAWKALGRSVKRGEHGVRVMTFVSVARAKGNDPKTGEKAQGSTGSRTPRRSSISHRLNPPHSGTIAHHGDQHGLAGMVVIPPSIPVLYFLDPGELAEDRWNETHGGPAIPREGLAPSLFFPIVWQ